MGYFEVIQFHFSDFLPFSVVRQLSKSMVIRFEYHKDFSTVKFQDAKHTLYIS